MAGNCRIEWVIAAVFGLLAFACTSTVARAADGSTEAYADSAEPLTSHQLEVLVGPVALYPDDLLAIVLPAATYPLQIVQAARYLEAVEDDPGLEPDPDWDESVIALLNYPEAVEKLNEDLDWTAALGEAVLEQEQELLAAVDAFRRKAYAAGNLASDRRQRVDVDEQYVRIRPADPAVIFVPYYQPALVHRPHLREVYHYHSRPCPVYYYPYPAGHYLASRHFWGVTGAFGISWHSRNLSFHLLDHRSHPYYGHDYAFRHYRYWRPRLMDDHRGRHGLEFRRKLRFEDRHHFEDRVRFGARRRFGGRVHLEDRVRFEDRIRSEDRPRFERRGDAGRRWRSDDGRRAVGPSPRERQRAEVPFTRPAAGTGLSRLQRYRDDTGASSSRDVRQPERRLRSSPSVAPRAGMGHREARPEPRTRARTDPPARESSAVRSRAMQRPGERSSRAGEARSRRAEGARGGRGSGVRVRPH